MYSPSKCSYQIRVEKDKLAGEADTARRDLAAVTDQYNQQQQQFYRGHVVKIFDVCCMSI